jgi:hypothetical protein
MEELVDLIGKVKLQDNTCTAIQIYVLQTGTEYNGSEALSTLL